MGKLPLHRAAAAISHRKTTPDTPLGSVICNLVEVYPEGASFADDSGCLPIHCIVSNSEVWDVEVETIFNANQSAVRTRCGKEFQNRLAIHLAASNSRAKCSLIERLVELHPQGLMQADNHGKLPLHLACECGKDWENGGLQVMYEKYPDAVCTPEGNSRGWTALHMASASRQNGVDLLGKLLEIYPEASRIADSHGRYALHWACASGKSWQGGMQYLFETNPDALSMVDKSGLLPLHIAAFQFAKDADSCDEETRSSSLDGILLDDVAAEAENVEAASQIDILYNLLRADPTVFASIV